MILYQFCILDVIVTKQIIAYTKDGNIINTKKGMKNMNNKESVTFYNGKNIPKLYGNLKKNRHNFHRW